MRDIARRHGSTFTIAVAGLIVLVLIFTSAGRVEAQSPPSISTPVMAITPDRATVGDRIAVTIAIDRAAGVTLTAPGFGTDFGGLEILAVAEPVDEHRGDGTVRTTFVFTLTSFKTGQTTVPAIPIAYTDASGAKATVSTEPRTITIASVLLPGETELRPLKPQLDIGSGAPSPVAPALFVAGFAGLTAFGYLLHRRIARIAPPPPVVAAAPMVVLTLEERARGELDTIGATGLAAVQPDEYYARMAATVRRYLSERFGFPAYALTRSEMELAMVAAGVERWPSRLTANLLAQCDAVEFGGFRPAPERCEADLTAAYEIVDLTAPFARVPAGTRSPELRTWSQHDHA